MIMKIVDIPSKGAPSRLLIPLHSKKIWLLSDLSKTLFFYHAGFSESLFHNYVVPSLKNSLSITLKHFPQLAGNLVVPHGSGIPVSHYSAGHFVALIISQSDTDFQRLTGDHFIDSDEFDDFVPHLPPPTSFSHQIIELCTIAIQITLFPSSGICIGLNIHHTIADGPTVDRFVRTWASTNKFISDDMFPLVVSNSDKHAAKKFCYMKMARPASPLASNVVEARFVLTKAFEKILIKFLLNRQKPAIATRDSTFVVASAYIWCCLAMSAASAGDMVSDDEPEFLVLALDYYSNNCSTPVIVESTHGALKRKGCFVAAADAITEAICNGNRRSLEDPRNLLTDLSDLAGNRKLVVGGSRTFDAYGVDYGWGRPQMFTSLTNKQVHICKSRDGGVEIVMWRPRVKMEAFAAIFDRGLVEVEDLHIISSL